MWQWPTCPTAGRPGGEQVAGVRAGCPDAMPQFRGEGGWQMLPPPRRRAQQPRFNKPMELQCRHADRVGPFLEVSWQLQRGRLPVPPVGLPSPTWEGKEAALAPISLATSPLLPAGSVALT